MRHDVYYYFQQACRRETHPVNPAHWVTEDEATAGFAIEVGALGRIEAVEYRCTTCMTLVALCEHVAEDLRGATLNEARNLSAGELLHRHPEIPPVRRARAHLAIAAAQAALEGIHL